MTHIVPASLSDLLFCFPVELWALKYMASTPSRRASYPLPVRQTCICYRLPLERLLPYAPCRVASSSPQRASRGTSTLQDMRPAGRTMKKPRSSYELRGFLTTGGRGGIRTLDRARPYAAFPGRYIQPLCHSSKVILFHPVMRSSFLLKYCPLRQKETPKTSLFINSVSLEVLVSWHMLSVMAALTASTLIAWTSAR